MLPFLAMHLALECFDILLPERQDGDKSLLFSAGSFGELFGLNSVLLEIQNHVLLILGLFLSYIVEMIFELLPLNSYFFFLGIFKEMIDHSCSMFITIDCKFKCFSCWNRKRIECQKLSEFLKTLFSMLLIKDSVSK